MKLRNRVLQAGLVALLLAISLVAGGCGDDDTANTANSGAADSMFVNGMIPHHQAAVEMAEDAQDRATRSEVKELADAIIESQNAEISQMEELQKELPDDSRMAMNADDMKMMQDDVEKVRAAADFDKAFLLAMVPHHQMAVEMSQSVLKNGENEEVATLANAIIAAQNKEIDQMQGWLQDWYGVTAPTTGSGSMEGHSMDHGDM